MLANPALDIRPGIFTGRQAAVADVAVPDPPPAVPTPRAPWARNHLTFRGTRIFTTFVLGWTGLILVAFGGIAVPAAHDLGRGEVDAGLMSLLGTVAPALWLLGVGHLLAAFGVARDRAWGFRWAVWSLAAGALVVAAGLVLAAAGRDAFALADPGSGTANGMGMLTWTLGLYAVIGWGLRRILAARALI